MKRKKTESEKKLFKILSDLYKKDDNFKKIVNQFEPLNKNYNKNKKRGE